MQQEKNPLVDFYNQLPPELQEKIQMLPPEKQQEVLTQLMQKYQQQGENKQFAEGGEVDSQQVIQMITQALQQGMQPEEVLQMLVEQGVPQEQAMQIIQSTQKQPQEQQFANGGQTNNIPVEAERNENITIQNGQQPSVEGGYLEQQSYNPVTGQSTYEIPDNEHNQTHRDGGVNMKLSEGDVVNSDKTKIPIDFKVYGKNFKNKTFKDASDYLSKQETKIQDDFTKNVKEGKTDKVSDVSLQIMLAKLGKNRDELNELQEQVLESKKQKEYSESLKSGLAEYGKVVLELNKAEHGLNTSLDRYLNYKVTDRPVLKAAEGLNASIEKFSKFADKITSDSNMSIKDIMSAYKQSGLSFNPKDNININKILPQYSFSPIDGSKVVGDFKSKIAQKETGSYKNPYIAIAGISEKEASTKSFDELKTKAASSGIGKYQFIWNIHKKDIERITGISNPDDFRYNPQAQEQFMDWFRDTKLLPQATELKQKYDVPLSVEQLMAMVHLEGKGGLEKKIKSGTLKTSTMAKNFKNASPLDYASNFREGGKIYAENGYTPTYKENSPESKKYFNEIVNYYKNQFPIEELRFTGSDNPTPLEMQQYVTNTFGKEAIADFMKNVPNTNKGIRSYNTKNTSNLTTDQAVDAFQDNKFAYRFPIFSVASDTSSLEDEGFTSNVNNDYSFRKLKNNEHKLSGDTSPQGYTYYIPETPQFKFSMQSNENEGINTKITDINTNQILSDWNFNPEVNKNVSSILEGIIDDGIKPDSDIKFKEEEKNENTNQTPITEANKTSWMDKLKYGIRESLPYLRNIALMREKQFNPVLQQKPYDNPYDNMRTDYNIQSNLNENQRALLTQMGDTRGNPSVRNARMAQIIANMQNNNNQLYTQKYNQELGLENQKVMGQSQYRGQLDDINRGLKKQFEHEVLQTREVARQQKNMAIDNMMNDYLRKQEQNQAIDLSLLETNYDWNPYTGKYEFNKEKAERNFKEKQFLAKNSSSSDNSKIIEGADGESYEIITPKSGKPIIRKIEKKYGGKVVKY